MFFNGLSLIFLIEASLLILVNLRQVQLLLPVVSHKALSLLRFYCHCICFLWGQFLRNTIFILLLCRRFLKGIFEAQSGRSRPSPSWQSLPDNQKWAKRM